MLTTASPNPKFSNFDVAQQQAAFESQDSFWAYRRHLNPDMLRGWWQEEIAIELQKFYDDLVRGLRPKLILEAPPQHGKTIQVIDFISWVAGIDPTLKTIYTSFSDDLGVAANTRLQRIFSGDLFRNAFPKTVIGEGAALNSSHIEYVDQPGSVFNTTVEGQVTGKGLNLGVIDDPIKGRASAESETTRNKIWSWFTDDFFTRFAEHSGLVLMLTRWHLDDPAGRMIAQLPNVKVLRYPAIAEKDETHRRKDEPLFPKLKSKEFLLERKSVMSKSAHEPRGALRQHENRPGSNPIGGNSSSTLWWKDVFRGTMDEVSLHVCLDPPLH